MLKKTHIPPDHPPPKILDFETTVSKYSYGNTKESYAYLK